jgi:hypothetical protein
MNEKSLRLTHHHSPLPDPIQFQALSQLGFTIQEISGMNVVELYDRVVQSLRGYKPEVARRLADQLFGPGQWKNFDFLIESQGGLRPQ